MSFIVFLKQKNKELAYFLVILFLCAGVVSVLIGAFKAASLIALSSVAILLVFQIRNRANTGKLMQRSLLPAKSIESVGRNMEEHLNQVEKSLENRVNEINNFLDSTDVKLDGLMEAALVNSAKANSANERLEKYLESSSQSTAEASSSVSLLHEKLGIMERRSIASVEGLRMELNNRHAHLEKVLKITERRSLGVLETSRTSLGVGLQETASRFEAFSSEIAELGQHVYDNVNREIENFGQLVLHNGQRTTRKLADLESLLVSAEHSSSPISSSHPSHSWSQSTTIGYDENEVERTSAEAEGGDALVKKRIAETKSRLLSAGREETQQIEALLQLLPKIAPRAPLPPSGQWAMDAQALLHLTWVFEQTQPRKILELGGGTSTIWLGYLGESQQVSLTSVDHDGSFLELTRQMVDRHALNEHIELRHAPLIDIDVNGLEYSWYTPAVFSDLENIDLLVVDGPPKATGQHARYPAMPILMSKLAPNCTVVLDDSARPDEIDAVQWWLESNPDFEIVDRSMSRLTVLRRAPEPS